MSLIAQSIIAGFVLASALVAFSLAFAAVLGAVMDRQERFSVEMAKRRGDEVGP